jgi:hypothetical protein
MGAGISPDSAFALRNVPRSEGTGGALMGFQRPLCNARYSDPACGNNYL